MMPKKQIIYSKDSTYKLKTKPSKKIFFKRYPASARLFKKNDKGVYYLIWDRDFNFEIFYSKVLFNDNNQLVLVASKLEGCNVHPHYINIYDKQGSLIKQFYLKDFFEYEEFKYLDVCGDSLKKDFSFSNDTLLIQFKRGNSESNFEKQIKINLKNGKIIDYVKQNYQLKLEIGSVEKYSIEGKVIIENNTDHELKLHPDINEFLTLGVYSGNGYIWYKKFEYPFYGADFNSRRIIPCLKPIIVRGKSEKEFRIKFKGKHFGVSGRHGFSVDDKKIKFSKYEQFKIRFDTRYPFEELRNIDTVMYGNGCFFCAPGNWGVASKKIKNFDKEKFESDYKGYFENESTCPEEYDKFLLESEWVRQ